MALRFRPADTTFYDLFTTSAGHLVDGASLLAEMLGDGNDREGIAQRMRDAEHAADETTHDDHAAGQHDVRHAVRPRGHLLARLRARRRHGLHGGGRRPDVLYEVAELPKELANQVEVIQRCAELTAESMPRLRTMKDLEEYWIEINRLENLGDKSYRRILAKLFSGKYDALEVLKLKDIVDSLEDAIDAFETVANIVEQIAVKES